VESVGEKLRLRHVAALAVIASLAALGADGAGAASTANAQSFIDPAFDERGGSPDIVSLAVSNDDDGMLEFRLFLRNRTELTDPDFITVNLDTDRSDSTGCNVGNGVGLDWVLAVRGRTMPTPDGVLLIRRSSCDAADPNVPQDSFVGRFDNATSTLVLQIDRAEIGNASEFEILVIASVDPPSPETWDLGGDLARWIYQVVVSPPRDEVAPIVKALPSSGRRGRVAKVRYAVFDESGRAREEITIRRGRRVLATRRTVLGARGAATIRVATWRVPKNVGGPLRFCVRAWDEAGNGSAPSCARLTLR
jgi:hypothetical protein